MSDFDRDFAKIRARNDQGVADMLEWMAETPRKGCLRLRDMLAEPDSVAMLARLTPEEADIVARLAILGFEGTILQGEGAKWGDAS